MKSKDRIWLLQYNGLGDAVLNLPYIDFLIELERTQVVFTARNAMLAYFIKILEYEKLKLLPDKFRSVAYVENIEEFVDNYKINKIISLRRNEGSLIRSRYVDYYAKIGVEYYCYEDYLKQEQINNFHIYKLNRLFFEMLNKRSVEKSPFHFFSNKGLVFKYCKKSKKIGLYFGASQTTKRLSGFGWERIITLLSSMSMVPVVYRAKSGEENKYEETILRMTTDFDVCVVDNWSIKSLYCELQEFLGFISCDTFIPHFVAAMGIPVFDIFISTNASIYGALGINCYNYQNGAYFNCSYVNNKGNCDKWGTCQDLTCVKECDIATLLEKITFWLSTIQSG